MSNLSKVKLPDNSVYDLTDAYKSGIYTVIGTQTASTSVWTGALHGVSALFDGLTIMYYLPWASTNTAVTLNLTLDNGTTTGAIDSYYGNTQRLTTHYGKGSNIVMTYYSAGSIKIDGTATTNNRWIANANYDTNDNGYHIRRVYSSLKAGANKIFPYTIIMENSDGRWESIVTSASTGTSKTRNTHGFRLGQILINYANTTYNENTEIANNNIWDAYTNVADMRYSFNVANDATYGMTAKKSVYLVGSLSSDGLFYLDTTWWTQTLPSTEDGKLYIHIGEAYDRYRIDFIIHKPIYHYSNGAIREFVQDAGSVNGHTVAKDVPADAVFTDNSGDDKLPLAGGTLTGPLGISYAATSDMTYNSTNPQVQFSENGLQGVKIIYSDYDAYRPPYGLKVIGDGSNAAGAWFEVEGDLYAKNLNGNLNPEKITAGYLENRVYHNIHPENGGGIIPFINNDLAFLTKKGGSYSFYSTTATDYTTDTISGTEISTSLTAVFDASPTYASVNRPQTEIDVIEITCHKMFTYSNVFYIDFGASNWRAKTITILVRNSNTETTWTQKGTISNNAKGHWWCAVSHTSTSGGSTVQGFNQLRVVLKDWQGNNNGRIAQIGLINYNSAGVNETFISRGGCNGIYGDLIPNENASMNLGSSSKKWLNAYVTNINGTAVGNAIGKNYTTSVTSGSADLVTSGAVYTAIANLPEPMVMKGTLGTGGTITSLPTASASNEGYTYKVITAGTYASQSAKVGDLFVSYNPSGSTYSWLLIPSGDETTSDTWRNIKVNGTEKLGNAISTGAVDFVNGTGTTVNFDATGNKVSTNVTYGNSANTACQGNDSRLSDARTPTSHTHGNITNGGALQTTDVAIASGDKLVVTDSSDSNKVARTSVSFDGSTTSTALTPKGTFESFAKASDITSAINALDGGTIGTPSASKTVTALSETNGQVSATFSDIAIANTQVSGLGTASTKDVPTSGNASNTQVVMGNDSRLSDSRTPTSHTHGNITNGGALQTNDITVANGDKLVVTDSSDSNKVARTSVSFDGSTTNKALTPKGTFEDFVQHYGDIKPLVSKTYASTSYYASANDHANATWYFMSVVPDSWNKPWRIKLKMHSFCPSYATYESYTYSTITGRKESVIYANWNERNASAHSYIDVYPLLEAGFNAGYGHAIGISIYNADNRTSSAYYRTFEVDYYECENCTVTLLDTPVKWASWTGGNTTNYTTLAALNAIDRGLQETGDANTVIENRIGYFAGKTGAVGVWSTGLFMEDANGTYQSICTASDGTVTSGNRTTGTKIANSHGFKVGSSIWYVNTNYNANTNISGQNVVYSAVSLFDTRYAFNTTRAAGSLTPYAPIYLVGTINVTDGLYYLDQVWWTQTPNDTTKVYVLVGGAFDSTTSNVRATLYEQNTWFKYNGTNLVDMSIGGEVNQNAFSNVKVGSTTIQADSQTDTLELVAGSNVTLTPDATNDKVTISATDTTYTSEQEAESGTAVSLVTTGEKYNWNHGIEEPLLHKEYTGNDVYLTPSIPSSWKWFFMSIKPDAYGEPWSVKYKVISYCTDYPENYTETLMEISQANSDSLIEGCARNYGKILSHIHCEYKRVNATGYNSGYGNAIGIQLSIFPTPYSDYYRTIIVDVYRCENCSVTLLDSPVKWTDWTGHGSTNYTDNDGDHYIALQFDGYMSSVSLQSFVDKEGLYGSHTHYLALVNGQANQPVIINECFKVKTDDGYMHIARNHTSTTSVDSGIWLGNDIPDGTAGAVRGVLNLFAANGCANYILPAENNSAGKLYTLPIVDVNSTLATTNITIPCLAGLTASTLDEFVALLNKGNGRCFSGTVKITANIGVGVTANSWNRVLMLSQNPPNNGQYDIGLCALFLPNDSSMHIQYAIVQGKTTGNYTVQTTGTLWDSNNAHDQNVKRNVDGSSNYLYRVLMSYNANDTTDISETRSSYLGYNPALKRLVINKDTNAMLEAPSNQLLYLRASNEANLGLILGVRKYNNQGMWSLSPEADGATYLMRLGMPNYRWNQIYSTSSSISTSDRNEKKDIVPLDESARDFIMALNPVSYKFINGESGRTHYGMIAQDVEEEMAELGMTALDFGGFCKDQKTVPYKRMEGECEITDDMPVEGEYRYGLRYEEFMAPAIKTIQLQQEELNELRTELAELKNELAQIKAMLNGGK